MRTKPIIVSLLVLIAIAAAFAWYEYRKVCCVDPPADEAVAPTDDADAPASDDDVPPDLAWDDDTTPVLDASPEGLYNDLKAASEDAHQKPSLEIERVPPPALPPPTRGEDDDPG